MTALLRQDLRCDLRLFGTVRCNGGVKICTSQSAFGDQNVSLAVCCVLLFCNKKKVLYPSPLPLLSTCRVDSDTVVYKMPNRRASRSNSYQLKFSPLDACSFAQSRVHDFSTIPFADLRLPRHLQFVFRKLKFSKFPFEFCTLMLFCPKKNFIIHEISMPSYASTHFISPPFFSYTTINCSWVWRGMWLCFYMLQLYGLLTSAYSNFRQSFLKFFGYWLLFISILKNTYSIS